MILSNLHNPSGVAMGRETLLEVTELAARVGAVVLVDEVYLDYCFSTEADGPILPACLVAPNGISWSSTTKCFGFSALRAGWIVAGTVALVALFIALALAPNAGAVLACSLLVGFLSGFIVLQYADVRASYPIALTGRAMSLLNMAMFLGVALMQWLSGAVASMASASSWHADTYSAALGLIAAMLALGVVAFVSLPAPE